MRANVRRAGGDKVGAYVGTHMDTKIILTKEKAEALVERIQKGLAEN